MSAPAAYKPGIVVIGYETSGMMRRAYQAAGYETYSIDLLPSEDGGEEMAYSAEAIPLGRHLQGDIFETLEHLRANDLWPELAIFHPECTYHAISAAWAFGDGPYHQKIKPGTLVGAARRARRDHDEKEVLRLSILPIKRKVIENPVGTLWKTIGKPQQIIQPYHFGEDASKKTCLWLYDVPMLRPTGYVKPRMICKACGGRNEYDDCFGHGCRHCGAEAGLLQPRWAN